MLSLTPGVVYVRVSTYKISESSGALMYVCSVTYCTDDVTRIEYPEYITLCPMCDAPACERITTGQSSRCAPSRQYSVPPVLYSCPNDAHLFLCSTYNSWTASFRCLVEPSTIGCGEPVRVAPGKYDRAILFHRNAARSRCSRGRQHSS